MRGLTPAMVKKFFASTAVRVELKAGAERGFAEAASGPISSEIKDTAAEVFEQTMRRESFNREIFNYQVLNEEVFKCPRVQKLFLSPGLEARFYKASGQLCKLMGEEASAPAMKGWVKAYDRCLKFEGAALVDDRANDLFKLMKIETTEGKKALRKSLEEFSATDGSGKFWLRDVEKIQAEGYRYSNFDPRFDRDGNLIAGEAKLRTADEPSGGWYTSFDKFDGAAKAKSSMQLPPASNAKYRLEFDYSAVKDKVRLTRGQHQEAEFFEPLCKDYPENGIGDASQVIVEGVDIPIKAIWDISGPVPIKRYPPPL